MILIDTNLSSIQELDHALTSMTMNIYVHALQDSDRKAADAISNLLGKQS